MQGFFQRFGAIIVGIIFLAVGLFMFFKNDSLTKNCTKETQATVVEMKEEFNTDSDTNNDIDSRYIYYPIIEYKVNDEVVRVTMSSGSTTPAYNINDKITVLYNPNKTNEFIVKGDSSLNIFSYVFIGLGTLILIAGIVIVFKKN